MRALLAYSLLGEAETRMPRLFYICYEFPVLTQTFTLGEVRGLLERGIDLEVVTCRRGEEVPGVRVRRIGARGAFRTGARLLGWFLRRPARLLALLGRIATARYRDERLRCWARGFLQLAWGAELASMVRAERGPVHLHAQFVDAASTVAFVASRLSGAPFSVTNHTAYNPYLLGPKLRHARRFFSISEFDRRLVLRQAGRRSARTRVLYQGIDTRRFGFSPPREPGRPLRILSVAALREKKGHHVLLEALSLLVGGGVDARLTIVGEGPERDRLERRVRAAALSDRVVLAGSEPPERVRERFRESDVFALACVVAANGDLDGIPISLMEAMASGLPVVSTRLSGIPELVTHGREGLLAPPGDAASFAALVRRVATEPGLSSRLARAAREKVCRQHDLRRSVERMARELFP